MSTCPPNSSAFHETEWRSIWPLCHPVDDRRIASWTLKDQHTVKDRYTANMRDP